MKIMRVKNNQINNDNYSIYNNNNSNEHYRFLNQPYNGLFKCYLSACCLSQTIGFSTSHVIVC